MLVISEGAESQLLPKRSRQGTIFPFRVRTVLLCWAFVTGSIYSSSFLLPPRRS
jgi:hypothetical protein